MEKEIFKKRPIIISAWICAGKTYLTSKYENVTELPSGDYKYILSEEQKAVKNKESLIRYFYVIFFLIIAVIYN